MIAEKYRPKTFEEVVGHEKTIAGLRWYLERQTETGQAFLLTGPSGVGKTSLAYCIAEYAGIAPYDVWRIESAQCDVEAVRKLADDMAYYGAGPTARKIYLIDEVHTVTGRAADRMLSLLENIPKHVLLVGTTTETEWTDGVLFSRWVRFDLSKPNSKLVAAHLERIAKAENLPIPDDPTWAEKMVKYAGKCGLNIRSLVNQLPARLLGEVATAA